MTGPQCDTAATRSKRKNAGGLVLLLLVAVGVGLTAEARPSWPPFLAPRDRFSPAVAAAVDRVWLEPTLSRRVEGRPARVPFDLYLAFVDTPEVTAAAGRHLGLAAYEVVPVGNETYLAIDGDESRGTFQVVQRETTRRVMLSSGEHHSALIGTITGSALTVLDLRPTPEAVEQALQAHVRIDQPFAAALARLLVALFGHIADRKLGEGIEVSARVAEWAVAAPHDFCGWLAAAPITPASRLRFEAAFDGCH